MRPSTRVVAPLLCACAFLAGCQTALPSGIVPEAMSLVAVQPGQVLPYGGLAEVCDMPEGAMGRPVEVAEGYTLYDSEPGRTGPRTHYITGFDDGCARQFTGGLAMFGDLESHAALLAAGGLPASNLDGLASGLRGASRSVFLTVYEGFGGRVSGDILLSGGEVVGAEF